MLASRAETKTNLNSEATQKKNTWSRNAIGNANHGKKRAGHTQGKNDGSYKKPSGQGITLKAREAIVAKDAMVSKDRGPATHATQA